MMNAEAKYSAKSKGNAGAFGPKTLTQLEAARDKSGKINLLQHLVHCVKKQREEALSLPAELKDTMNGAASIKYDDLDKAMQDAKSALKKFGTQSEGVVKYLEKNGKGDDPYIKDMHDFKAGAEEQLEKLTEEYAKLKSDFMSVLVMWSSPKKIQDKPSPDEFFGSLVPFIERFKAEADAIEKEAAKTKKKKAGGKLTSGAKKGEAQGIDNLVGNITEGIIAS